MAPEGTCEVQKAQLDAKHNSKESDFERDSDRDTKVLSHEKKFARAMIVASAKWLRSIPEQ